MLGNKPKITSHPHNQTVKIASDTDSLSLSSEAVGATSYSWERQNSSISSGATGVNTKTLTIVNLTPEDAGNYRCIVSNDSGRDYFWLG